MSKLSFIAASDRKYVISRTMSLIKSDIVSTLKDKKNVIVKPYCFYSSDQLSSTHVDALEAVLDFISPYITTQINLAEGTSVGRTLESFRNYDYFKLQDIYDFAVVDLNDEPLCPLQLESGEEIKVPEAYLKADAIVSVCPPRYDQRMLFAGTIINVLEPLYRYNSAFTKKLVNRFSIRKEPENLSKEFFEATEICSLFKKLPVVLSVIDAYSIKKGVTSSHLNTPHWASASIDAVSCDCLACQLLGVELSKVGYLDQAISTEDLEQNIVVGDDWRNHIISA